MKEKFMNIVMEVLECEESIDFSTQLETLEWNSIARLTFAAMLNEELQATISASGFNNSTTVQNLFDAMIVRAS